LGGAYSGVTTRGLALHPENVTLLAPGVVDADPGHGHPARDHEHYDEWYPDSGDLEELLGEAEVLVDEAPDAVRELAGTAGCPSLAEAEEAARTEELDSIEAAGRTGELSDQQARQLLGVPVRRGDGEYVTTDEVRRRLGLPR
jgi:hypothetical protein